MNKQQAGLLVKHLNKIIESVQGGEASDFEIKRTMLYRRTPWWEWELPNEQTGERIEIDITIGSGVSND